MLSPRSSFPAPPSAFRPARPPVLNLADYFKTNNLQYNPVVFEKEADATSAYDSGRCDVYTTDQSGLYAIRLKLKNPDDNIVLPEVISKGAAWTGRSPGRRPVVRHRDLGSLRHGQCRRTGHHLEKRR